MIVCKFGGTSVGSSDAIRRLAEIVRHRTAERPLVVVSALAGVTNRLLQAADDALGGRAAEAVRILEAVVVRHRETAKDLELPLPTITAVDAAALLVEAWLADPQAFPTPDGFKRRGRGPGELWSSLLVAAALERAGVRSEWVDIRPIIVTDDRYTRAIPDQAAIAERAGPVFAPLLDAGVVPVTQGFLGATRAGATTTLGRGGSDFTASLLGAALGASRVEIWTDVDGIMTADPRIVPGALVLPTSSHWEATELATFGAKVIHPATQAPLIEAKIPCIVLNSFAPDRPGTAILVGVEPEPIGTSPVRSISWKRGVTVVNVRAATTLGPLALLRTLFDVCARHEAEVDLISTSEVKVSLTFDGVPDLRALVRDLECLGDVTVFENRAIVAVVGLDLRGARGIAARLFRALETVNVEMISQGPSDINVTMVVLESDGPRAVHLLHDEFFGGEAA